MLQINFLCVSENLRDTKFTPMLIGELKRRMNLQNRWQAVYTVVKKLPTPVAKVNYWHRLINVNKLNRLRFSDAKEQDYKILGTTSYFREMAVYDIPRVTNMLQEHLKKFKLFRLFSLFNCNILLNGSPSSISRLFLITLSLVILFP